MSQSTKCTHIRMKVGNKLESQSLRTLKATAKVDASTMAERSQGLVCQCGGEMEIVCTRSVRSYLTGGHQV
jgi:hypothetical protein